VVARAERPADPVARAAVLLVAIATERPFAADNDATAWLATAVVLAEAGIHASFSEDAVVDLVHDAGLGAAEVGDVVAAITDAMRAAAAPSPSAGWLTCPACGRRLERTVGVGTWRYEVIARCSVTHRAHDRSGREYAPAPSAVDDDGWRPVLVDAGSSAWLVLTDAGAVLVDRVPGGYRLAVVGDVPVSALVGSWDRLRDGATFLATIGEDDFCTDEAGRRVDWRRIESELGWTTSPPRLRVPAPA
jgi:hypothetical protein